MEKDSILFEAILLNGMRALQKKEVEKLFYNRQRQYDENGTCEGTMGDLIDLQKREEYLCKAEEEFENRISGLESFPDYISVNDYANQTGFSIWKVYREIKKKNIIAEKVKGRWRIYTRVELISNCI